MYSGSHTVSLLSVSYLQYDPTFGNAFWNSSSEGFAMYLFLLLTNWALVCDVWYLPKTTRQVRFRSRYPVGMGSRDGATRLQPMWSGFDSWTRRHMWVEFVVGSRPCSERFFSGYSGFPLSSKTNISNTVKLK